MHHMSPSTLTQEALAARTQRAVSTAVEAAGALGLACTDPRVLHDMFSVVVHLRPSPVVARIPVVLPKGVGLDALRGRQARELAVVRHLDEGGIPVVKPSPLVAPEPTVRDGLSMTFWQYVEVQADVEPDYLASVALVPPLHAALRAYRAELPLLSPVASVVPSGLAYLAAHPGILPADDIARAQREWAMLAPCLESRSAFEAAFPGASVQAVHGDAPYYNLIRTPGGPLYADFEDVTLAPPEWDMAGLPPEFTEAYDRAAAKAGVRPLQPEALRAMTVARNLQMVAIMSIAPELPILESALAPLLQNWRTQPLADGLR